MGKTFAGRPKPRTNDEAIVAFERGGTGHDTVSIAAPVKGDPAPSQKTAQRLSIDLPVEKHRRLKMACAGRGLKMNAVIEGMIDRLIVELEAGYPDSKIFK